MDASIVQRRLSTRQLRRIILQQAQHTVLRAQPIHQLVQLTHQRARRTVLQALPIHQLVQLTHRPHQLTHPPRQFTVQRVLNIPRRRPITARLRLPIAPRRRTIARLRLHIVLHPQHTAPPRHSIHRRVLSIHRLRRSIRPRLRHILLQVLTTAQVQEKKTKTIFQDDQITRRGSPCGFNVTEAMGNCALVSKKCELGLDLFGAIAILPLKNISKKELHVWILTILDKPIIMRLLCYYAATE